MNVLIVNDEVIAVQGMLQGIDWEAIGIKEVKTAYDAMQAKDIIKAGWNVDIILCDIEMPGENGIELLSWIVENGYEMEKIILTCHADFEFAQRAVGLGCMDYILTPATFECISEKLQAASELVKNKNDEKQKQHYGDLWLDKYKKDEPEGVQKKSEDVIGDVATYICDNLDNEELTVSRIAEIYFLNPDYLNRLFKKHKGKNIRQFIMDERMGLAETLIKEDRYSLQQISSMVGYNSYQSFTVAFRNYHNMSPSEYKDSLKSDFKY